MKINFINQVLRSMKFRILFIIASMLVDANGCTPAISVSSFNENLHIVSVQAWGGTPAIDSLAHRQRIRYITLHHEGETFPKQSIMYRTFANLQEWSRRVKHWIDIPYHYIIDLNGKSRRRREEYAGDTNTD